MEQAPQTAQETAKLVKKGEIAGVGALIQLAGIIVFLASFMLGAVGAVFGFIVLIIALLVGSRMAIKWKCSNCGNKVLDKHVKMCPTCKFALTR